MKIDPINSASALARVGNGKSVSNGSADGVGGTGAPFKDSIKKAIKEVNHLQSEADKFSVQLATGEIEDVHKAMIAMQKAKLALDLTIQVRNKVIEAYQEIMRMQI